MPIYLLVCVYLAELYQDGTSILTAHNLILQISNMLHLNVERLVTLYNVPREIQNHSRRYTQLN